MASNTTELLADTSNQNIMKQLEVLRHRTLNTGAQLKCLVQEQEAFELTKTKSNAGDLEIKASSPHKDY